MGAVAGNGFDAAPADSPSLVSGIPVVGGLTYTFSATGIVSHGFFDPQGHGPEGVLDSITSREPGAENGIGDVNAPFDGADRSVFERQCTGRISSCCRIYVRDIFAARFRFDFTGPATAFLYRRRKYVIGRYAGVHCSGGSDKAISWCDG